MIAGRFLLTAALVALPAAAFAQADPAPAPAPAPSPAAPRFYAGVSAGVQAKASTYTDSFEVPLYLETETVSTVYPEVSGLFVSFDARYRIWKQLTVGIGVSSFMDEGDAAVTARLPHPFFDNTLRTIEGTVNTKREELAVYPTAGWIVPFSPSVHLAVSAGPSIMTVKQQFVTNVNFTEAYPYDTATFTSADLTQSSATAVGFYVGADVAWMFSKHVGAGGLVQLTRATVKEKVGDRTVSIDAGGVQAGGGIRFVF